MNELDDLTLIMQGKAGDTAAVNELWKKHQNFIRMQMAKVYIKNKSLAARVGIDRDDLIVEGWFAVRDAVRRYDPGKRMAFLTVLGWSIRATATKVLTTSRGKLLRDENGKQTRVPADPLNYALSSDLPLEDDTDNTIEDVYADPTVNLEQDFENEQNRRAVMAALYSLKPNHRSILEQRYRYNRTLQEIADDRGVSRHLYQLSTSMPSKPPLLLWVALWRARWHSTTHSISLWMEPAMQTPHKRRAASSTMQQRKSRC